MFQPAACDAKKSADCSAAARHAPVPTARLAAARPGNQALLRKSAAAAGPQRSRLLQRACSCGNDPSVERCPECWDDPDAAPLVQRSALSELEGDAAPATVETVLDRPGAPLDEATRLTMERQFAGHGGAISPIPASAGAQSKLTIGPAHDHYEQQADRVAGNVTAAPLADAAPAIACDFSRVRIHADAEAARSARSVNARAYTVGHSIVFGAREFAPDTSAGRRLLAHELTHVLQQDPSLLSPAADRSAAGPARTSPPPVQRLQRWWVNGPVTDARNTILCDGKGGIRVQLGWIGMGDDVRCLADCYETHENSHKADALAFDPNICKGKDDGAKLKYSSVAERNASERKAYTAEIDCLTPQLAKVGPVCKEIMQKRIAQVEKIRAGFK